MLKHYLSRPILMQRYITKNRVFHDYGLGDWTDIHHSNSGGPSETHPSQHNALYPNLPYDTTPHASKPLGGLCLAVDRGVLERPGYIYY